MTKRSEDSCGFGTSHGCLTLEEDTSMGDTLEMIAKKYAEAVRETARLREECARWSHAFELAATTQADLKRRLDAKVAELEEPRGDDCTVALAAS